MKRTLTKRREIFGVCGCGGNPECRLCGGTGRYLGEIVIETTTEEYPEPRGRFAEEIVEAELTKDAEIINE